MGNIENLEDFYNNIPQDINYLQLSADSRGGHFNIIPRWRCAGTYLRRDFYKLVLVIGTGILKYAEKKITIDRPAIFLTNPIVPYSWEPISETQDGWICLFTKEFIQQNVSGVQNYPLLFQSDTPVFFFDEEEFIHISALFEKMAEEMKSDYIYKYSTILNYLQLLIHEIQKQQFVNTLHKQQINAAPRRTYQFLQLLEQQFPLDSPEMPIVLKTPQDFANKLAIHVNHLNSSVKATTGKTTSQLIADYIVKEAKALLQNTDWSIAQIAYALGFEYPSHFTGFVKKRTGLSPKEIRDTII